MTLVCFRPLLKAPLYHWSGSMVGIDSRPGPLFLATLRHHFWLIHKLYILSLDGAASCVEAVELLASEMKERERSSSIG